MAFPGHAGRPGRARSLNVTNLPAIDAGGTAVRSPRRPGSAPRAIARVYRRSRALALVSLLSPAVVLLVAIYLVSLGLLVFAALYSIDDFTFQVTDERTWDNLATAFTNWDFVWVVIRSVLIALSVTGLCLVIGLPVAFYIAKIASPWARRGLLVATVLPLWAGYLVKGYAWRALLRPAGQGSDGGFFASVFGFTPGYSLVSAVLALTYLWLPYMILPVYAGLERLPASLLDAAGDLGARPLRTFTSVIMPMLVPSIAAGSIFTFSLSLGDYITPRLVTDGNVTMIGNLIYSTLLAPNQPLAAAFTLWPLLIITVYLLAMKRVGAFESL
jgi:putative spermidine/putrescine transport system permease protein